jgi:transcriptional regulator with XRE-family HTH domain
MADSGRVPKSWTLGDTLRWLRDERDWSQKDLADRAGVGLRTVIRMEGKDGANYEMVSIEAVAGAFGLSAPALLAFTPFVARDAGREVDPEHEADHLSLDVYDGYVKNDLPVIAEGEASFQGELFWDASEGRPLIEAEEWTSRPFDLKDPKAYAIKVRGDSMLPVFAPGMLLIVSPNAHVKAKQGDNAYVQLHSGERLIKRVRKQAGGWILESYNRAYDTRFVPVDEVGSVHRIVYAKF